MTGESKVFDERFAITGKDLYFLRYKLGISLSDFCWYFGIREHLWSNKFSNTDRLENPSEQILALLLDANPEFCPVYQQRESSYSSADNLEATTLDHGKSESKEQLVHLAQALSKDKIATNRTFSHILGKSATYFTVRKIRYQSNTKNTPSIEPPALSALDQVKDILDD